MSLPPAAATLPDAPAREVHAEGGPRGAACAYPS
jgi:hypothetical protein